MSVIPGFKPCKLVFSPSFFPSSLVSLLVSVLWLVSLPTRLPSPPLLPPKTSRFLNADLIHRSPSASVFLPTCSPLPNRAAWTGGTNADQLD